jgi:hypothetical protein
MKKLIRIQIQLSEEKGDTGGSGRGKRAYVVVMSSRSGSNKTKVDGAWAVFVVIEPVKVEKMGSAS